MKLDHESITSLLVFISDTIILVSMWRLSKLYIDFENEHTQYSPERVDPCPDFYGLFSLRFEKNHYEIVGDYMTIEELDSIMCALINFTEFKSWIDETF